MNDPAVFLSYTWTDEAAADLVEQALRARGLTVLRAKDIRLFDGITEKLRRELGSAAVLLAFYSRRYSIRYACQWELTKALLAARRIGDPDDRVLVINPEPDDLHIAPVELAEAGCLPWRGEPDIDRMADAVADRVRRADTPFGEVTGDEPHRGVPRRFVGRYPEMWAIHSRLLGGRPPRSHSVVVIEAPAGMGKTTLAEQYASVFRDAYPGGVVWTSLAEADGVPARFAAAVNELARERFGVDLSDMNARQAKATVAGRIVDDTLWVVDDVPDGLDRDTLEQLVIPSPKVHTLMAMRTVPSQWPCSQVRITGFSVREAEELFRANWTVLSRDERRAIGRLVTRSQGHPLTILPIVDRLRDAQGTGAVERMADEPVLKLEDGLTGLVRARSAHARVVLGFLAVLGRAPISGDLVARGISEVLGGRTPILVAEALDELDRHRLIQRAAGNRRQAWRLHALVADAVTDDLDPTLLSSLARHAAGTLLGSLANASMDLCAHALRVAKNAAVPSADRLALIRGVVMAHEARGDIAAARDAGHLVIRVAAGDWQISDVATAARLAVVVGDALDALGHTDKLIDRAQCRRDVRTEFKARQTAATAYDMLGDYVHADALFHQHDLLREHGAVPVWLSEVERQQAELARLKALILRGDYEAARRIADGVLPALRLAHPHGAHKGPWPFATVELARLQLLSGELAHACGTARKVLDVFGAAGLVRHRLAREAVVILTEAELTMALTEMRVRPEQWSHATKRLQEALDESTEWYGPDDPLTLELMVLRGRTLSRDEEHRKAVAVLADAHRRASAALGEDHPLSLRARQWTGLVTMGSQRWEAAADLFERLLPRQDAVLGRCHPESQFTRFHLGACLLRRNDLKKARLLLDEAVPVLHAHQGPLRQWTVIVTGGDACTRVPNPLRRFVNFLDKSVG
ncbi:TIR domain-containing protein [Kibdelosporangium persicum]|uniref:AAA domain-containing protein n=1 Tax=Kibdelosporangium persicum TaxID=2698649 RepID=A0ABX2FIA7_9PSEU|nr:TIR domain-containing protein [Kibdelosporangium persicum]NRN70592.1 AAA domain-containing protein [Kibdelosporangium persicum]